MKKRSLLFGFLTCLALHSAALAERADHGVECSIEMNGQAVDAKKPFPDFMLVFSNEGDKAVRLFDDFFPDPKQGPNIMIEVMNGEGKKVAFYCTGISVEHVFKRMQYITLYPEQKLEVSIENASKLIKFFKPLGRGETYTIEVTYRDGYGQPGVRMVYVARKKFLVK